MDGTLHPGSNSSQSELPALHKGCQLLSAVCTLVQPEKAVSNESNVLPIKNESEFSHFTYESPSFYKLSRTVASRVSTSVKNALQL